MKKAFQRTCIGCNKKASKEEFIRIVATKKEKQISVDITGKKEGRGAYICSKEECLNKALKTNRLNKVLKTNIDKKIYEDIRGVIVERESKN